MRHASKIVLQLSLRDPGALAPFVEACVRDGVSLIAIFGDGARAMEDQIDDLVVGDGSDESRFIVTTAHTDETLEDVLQFARNFGEEFGDVQIVKI
jgi:hypothetical protein